MSEEVPEPWIESFLQRAADRGEFDDLPLAGRPIPDLGRRYAPGWWIRRFVERERAEGRDPFPADRPRPPRSGPTR